jgi:hypothetical protein
LCFPAFLRGCGSPACTSCLTYPRRNHIAPCRFSIHMTRMRFIMPYYIKYSPFCSVQSMKNRRSP